MTEKRKQSKKRLWTGLREHLSRLWAPTWVIDRPSFRGSGEIFCEIFSRHHFPVRCVTFCTRVAEFISCIWQNNCLAGSTRLFLRRFNSQWAPSIPEDCLLIIIALFRSLRICIIALSATNIFSNKYSRLPLCRMPQNRKTSSVTNWHISSGNLNAEYKLFPK